jgi:streptogramin lyase
MGRKNRASFALPLLAGMLVGLTEARAANPTEAAAAVSAGRPAHLEAIDGSTVKKITLTPKAAQRLDIQTGKVRQDASGRKVVPYAAVVYDKDGSTWVYTSPQPLTYIRHVIIVELIRGEDAVLKEGPDVGMQVATTGAPQLYGAEKGVGH